MKPGRSQFITLEVAQIIDIKEYFSGGRSRDRTYDPLHVKVNINAFAVSHADVA